jgi:SAM-dependent methyltransferase
MRRSACAVTGPARKFAAESGDSPRGDAAGMYASHTSQTSEFFKSIAHSRRFDQASRIVPLRSEMKLFDYGCGDGAFFENLSNFCPRQNLYGFDPWFLDEMRFEGATTFSAVPDFIDALAGAFDVIYCIEVCEHLTDAGNATVFANMKTLAKPGATFVFGVPIETGFSALAKNLYRCLKGGRQGATLARTWRTALSLPVERQWEDGWCGSHLGFSHRRFAQMLAAAGFTIERTHCLPLHVTGAIFNNEIYFVCRA